MRAVLQRVSRASVTVEGRVTGAIDRGLVVLLGVAQGDGESQAAWMAQKVAGLRVFADAAGKMNLDVAQAGGALLVISQFTLLADVRSGKRPAFTGAMEPVEANRLYERVVELLRATGIRVETGVFRADMQVELVNDGPVTLVVDSVG